MKKYTASALWLVLLFALQAFAQEHYTEGRSGRLPSFESSQLSLTLT